MITFSAMETLVADRRQELLATGRASGRAAGTTMARSFAGWLRRPIAPGNGTHRSRPAGEVPVSSRAFAARHAPVS